MSAVSKAWAEAVKTLYGPWCLICGSADIELDHVMPKSQGGPYHPGNGVPLCGPFSPSITGGHHKAKTEGRLKYPTNQLHTVTLEFLADARWVAFGEDGQPYGRGWRHFEPMTVGSITKGGTRV